MPDMEANKDAVGGAKYLMVLDLLSAYHLMPVAETDTPKPAIVTQDGPYVFKRMPFGVSNAR